MGGRRGRKQLALDLYSMSQRAKIGMHRILTGEGKAMDGQPALYRHNSAEIATEAFEDGVVSINFLTGRYFSFNPAGEQVWAAFATAAEPGCRGGSIRRRGLR